MPHTWTVRAKRDDERVTEYEGTSSYRAIKAYHDGDDTILLRNGRVMPMVETSEQLTMEHTP